MKKKISQQLVNKSTPKDADCCVLANTFNHFFPELLFQVLPYEPDGELHVFKNNKRKLGVLQLTKEQTIIGAMFDNNESDVVGMTIEIPQVQIDEIYALMEQKK